MPDTPPQHMEDNIEAAVARLMGAFDSGKPCAPIRDLIGTDSDAAYAIQERMTDTFIARGRRLVGRKIGLTAPAIQAVFGTDQPDSGALFADMEYASGSEIPHSHLHQPRAEAEIAFVMKHALTQADATPSELIRAIDFVAPAIEIVGSRIADWDITLADTIADNASSGVYVLGGPTRSLTDLDLVGANMVLKKNGRAVGFGAGAACMGNPLNAVLWLARRCATLGQPLQSGDVILSGALSPMVEIEQGDSITTEISGIGRVEIFISKE